MKRPLICLLFIWMMNTGFAQAQKVSMGDFQTALTRFGALTNDPDIELTLKFIEDTTHSVTSILLSGAPDKSQFNSWLGEALYAYSKFLPVLENDDFISQKKIEKRVGKMMDKVVSGIQNSDEFKNYVSENRLVEPKYELHSDEAVVSYLQIYLDFEKEPCDFLYNLAQIIY